MNREDNRQGKLARAAILFAIADFIEIHGYSPTVRDICEAVGLSSTSTITAHLKQMRSARSISYVDESPRTIRILAPYIFSAHDEPWLVNPNTPVKKHREYISQGWPLE